RDLQAALFLVMLLVFSASMAFAQRASKVGKAENKEMLERSAAEGLPIAAQSLISATIGRDQGAYRAVATRQGFRLKKPQSTLHAEFTRQGVRVGSGAEGSWGLRLEAYGAEKELRAVAGVKPQADENRVEYRRGALTEWYVNGPAGLEQGFTLSKP